MSEDPSYVQHMKKVRMNLITNCLESIQQDQTMLETYVAAEKRLDAVFQDKHSYANVEEALKLVHNARIRLKRAVTRLEIKPATATLVEAKHGDSERDDSKSEEPRVEGEDA
jgi:hypothetical protein